MHVHQACVGRCAWGACCLPGPGPNWRPRPLQQRPLALTSALFAWTYSEYSRGAWAAIALECACEGTGSKCCKGWSVLQTNAERKSRRDHSSGIACGLAAERRAMRRRFAGIITSPAPPPLIMPRPAAPPAAAHAPPPQEPSCIMPAPQNLGGASSARRRCPGRALPLGLGGPCPRG